MEKYRNLRASKGESIYIYQIFNNYYLLQWFVWETDYLWVGGLTILDDIDSELRIRIIPNKYTALSLVIFYEEIFIRVFPHFGFTKIV